MTKLKEGTLLEVFWHDSFGCAEWIPKELEPELIEVKQLGYFIRQTKKGIFLATGIPTGAHQNVLGISFIPKGCITKIRRLK
jgi:hypothetical protein